MTRSHNAIVTGGAGFIGSALVDALLRHPQSRVTVFDKLTYAGRLENLAAASRHAGYRFVKGDILDGHHFRAALEDARPSVVYHLAAESHVDRSIEDGGAFVRTNVEGTERVLAATLEYYRTLDDASRAAFRFVHVSTDEVFGTLGHEGAFNEASPFAPNSPYAASKAASDMIARSYFRTFGLPVVITNCSNNFGPRQFPEKLIPLCLVRALAGQPLPIYGKGEQIRDWLFVEDHVDALMAVAERAPPGESFCIGGGTELPNLDTINRLCALLDRLRPRASLSYAELITFVDDRPGHDFRYSIDSSKIARQLGWRPRFSFAEALEATVVWYLDNEAWLAPLAAQDAGAEVTRRRGLANTSITR
ncbi:dTDP-glucose 4,6-dehydratase [Afipia sp. TerB]